VDGTADGRDAGQAPLPSSGIAPPATSAPAQGTATRPHSFGSLAIHILIGAVEGVVVCWLPLFIALFAVAGLLLLWILRAVVLICYKDKRGWSLLGLRILTAFVVVPICGFLPVKWEDGIVEPVRCGPMRADDLAKELGPRVESHLGVVVYGEEEERDKIVSFSTDRSMTRKQFLGELARQTGFKVDASCCGLGHSILFGEAPRVITLSSPESSSR
jgi:hypothetical protein